VKWGEEVGTIGGHLAIDEPGGGGPRRSERSSINNNQVGMPTYTRLESRVQAAKGRDQVWGSGVINRA